MQLDHKAIKEAWAKSLGYNNFNELSEKLDLDAGAVDSLLKYSYKHSDKFTK